MSDKLASQECIPCHGGVPTLKGDILLELLAELGHDWEVIEEHHLEKTYKFDDWAQAMVFANKVSDIAEEQNHHPDLYIGWGTVKVQIWSHKIDGLTESDFVFAAKVERALGA
jgi:4a-hydroxytetrahydrobiopterin dehydratase